METAGAGKVHAARQVKIFIQRRVGVLGTTLSPNEPREGRKQTTTRSFNLRDFSRGEPWGEGGRKKNTKKSFSISYLPTVLARRSGSAVQSQSRWRADKHAESVSNTLSAAR